MTRTFEELLNQYQLFDQESTKNQELKEGKIYEGEAKDAVVERPEKKSCCSHTQELKALILELEKLRKESKSNADKISSLQKLVVALSCREGLA